MLNYEIQVACGSHKTVLNGSHFFMFFYCKILLQRNIGLSLTLRALISFLSTLITKALFTRVRYRTVPLRSVPKSGTERGCVHTGTAKIKRSVPKQVQKLGGTEK